MVHASKHRQAKVASVQFPNICTLNLPGVGVTSLGTAHTNNQNLDDAQRELLLWHKKLGHKGMLSCQQLFGVPHNTSLFSQISQRTKGFLHFYVSNAPLHGLSVG